MSVLKAIFDARAREIMRRLVPCEYACGPGDKCECANQFAAALKAAYNEGLEGAALCCEQIARGEIGAMFSHVACAEEACAAAVRAKKVP